MRCNADGANHQKGYSRMAHHNSTPASVLDAPTPSREVVSLQIGYSRAERRHGVYYPPTLSPELRDAIAAERTAAGRNTPAVSAKVSKVRKGRKARFNRSAA